MNVTVVRVEPQYLDDAWPHVLSYLEKAVPFCEGEIDTSQMRMLVASGRASLFIAASDRPSVLGAAVVETIQYPNFRVANVVAIGGSSRYKLFNEDLWRQFSSQLKSMGYSKIQGYCRPSMARLLRKVVGARDAYIVSRLDL